jgi:hypothetical protein
MPGSCEVPEVELPRRRCRAFALRSTGKAVQVTKRSTCSDLARQIGAGGCERAKEGAGGCAPIVWHRRLSAEQVLALGLLRRPPQLDAALEPWVLRPTQMSAHEQTGRDFRPSVLGILLAALPRPF